ncbi:hypothetical protein BDFB_012106 [Asbolus verrucosus]|uniref:Uncharacterized protein n=1 Tax=Asbolus verrucosus TaxID=1661398 RepID=A0A482W8V0_ASBVE|nr:hypothetical protein BDFB_012106 [Asbolus verrucosus]
MEQLRGRLQSYTPHHCRANYLIQLSRELLVKMALFRR